MFCRRGNANIWVLILSLWLVTGPTRAVEVPCLTIAAARARFGALEHRVLSTSERTTVHKIETADRKGGIYYTLSSDGTKLFVALVKVDLEIRRQGLSDYLISEALRLSGPNVQVISAKLELDNFDFYNQAIQAGASDPKQAVKNTPFYRSFKKLGFQRVTLAEPYRAPRLNTDTDAPAPRGVRIEIQKGEDLP